MLEMLELFTPVDIAEHMVPIAMILGEDKVAVVRLAAFKLVSTVLLL